MLPDLAPGDLLLISYRAKVRDRQIVVARLVDGAIVVKRAAERRRTRTGEHGWWLLSANPAVGVDSRHRGVVPDTEVFGVALARVWPRPRRLTVARSPALRRHK